MNGTPSYIIGDNVAIGAVGLAALADKVNLARRSGPEYAGVKAPRWGLRAQSPPAEPAQ